MERQQAPRPRRGSRRGGCDGDVPGIVILDGGQGSRIDLKGPRVRAFVYGEEPPPTPTLPFGRWKVAS